MTRPPTARHHGAADSSAAVDDFMRQLEHPFKAEIEALRGIILGADARIAEGIKWNAPSFRTSEYFATTHLRAKAGVGLVLHLGAKVRHTAVDGLTIPDPAKLLTWLAKDRAMVLFTGLDDITARRGALATLVQEWIKHV